MAEYGNRQFDLAAKLQRAQPTKDEFGACLFPLLTDGVIVEGEDALLQSVRKLTTVDLGPLRDVRILREFCTRNGVALPTVFNTAWALVLGTYMGTDAVRFLVHTSEPGVHREAIFHVQLDKTEVVDYILRDVEAKVKESFDQQALSLLSDSDLPVFRDDHRELNSAVVYQAAHSIRPTSILKRFQNEVSYSLKEYRGPRRPVNTCMTDW